MDKRLNQLTKDYCALMLDVRVRNDAINNILVEPGLMPPRLVREFCYLQLRMIAELVALGCVVLHDQLPATQVKKLRKDYNADRILKDIEGYEPGFFPRAIERVREVSPGHKEVEPVQPPVMTASDLRRIWGRTGDVLHWGTVNKMRERTDIDPKHKDVRLLQRKFVDLLSVHFVLTAKETQPFICELHSAATGGVRMVAVGIQLDPSDPRQYRSS
ncbi:hypothetical protein [Brevundimonas sp.]|uniref:hypothetical protein n=1 Tax=Brevundimonas sp. TaxID=1871086 RepID=UPI001D63DE74|nr:hypothetical protein [Brevundimonas sp.]MBA4001225.1 hypothetical protein [Brevundimonas sp.]